MTFELLTKEELLTAAIATKRPVAFLVGAPLSLTDTGERYLSTTLFSD